MPEWLAAFLIALVVGTLVEYWGHRAMHTVLLRKKHAEHHRAGVGQGWLGEFIDYVVGVIPILPLGFLYSMEAGIGFAGGGIAYAIFAAYSHQLQHERPELCFWMVRPCHALHHEQHMWKSNFGISLDIWDRVFGTYKKVDWVAPARPRTLKGFLQIRWF